jgi:hypothetical protein
LREAFAELDRLSRIEDKYVNLCPVLNEQAGEIERLQRIEAAAREEHGGRAYDVECPICYALDQGDPKIDSVPEPFRSRTMKIHCDMHGWQYTIGMKCMECAKVAKTMTIPGDPNNWVPKADYDALQAQIERLTAELTQAREGRWPQIVEVLNGHLAEIERLRAELAAAPRVMIHEHWNAPHVDDELTHPSAHPSTPWEVP